MGAWTPWDSGPGMSSLWASTSSAVEEGVTAQTHLASLDSKPQRGHVLDGGVPERLNFY